MTDDLRLNFHTALDALDDQFTSAGLRIAEQMPRLVEAFLDGSTEAIAEGRSLAEVVSDECREVEDRGFVLVARHQPVGSDLRRLVAMLRMTVDVDRSAALLRHLIEVLRVIDPRDLPDDVNGQLAELARLAADVYAGGIDAWRAKDGLAVNELDERDEKVDQLQRLLLDSAAASESIEADARVLIGLMARYLERIADHGVAIARDTAFVATGERVTLPSKAI